MHPMVRDEGKGRVVRICASQPGVILTPRRQLEISGDGFSCPPWGGSIFLLASRGVGQGCC